MEIFKSAWGYITNPPQELVTATYELGSGIVKCVTGALINYGETVIEIVKKTV